VRLAASVGLAVSAVVALGGQAVGTERILATASQTFVGLGDLAADLAQADVAFLHAPAGAPDAPRVEMALLQALASRRPDIVFALDVIARASQEPLEHFQMGHLSDHEFVAESRIPSALAAAYLPLLKFAVARTWTIVATGPAEAGGEGPINAALVQAVTLGATGQKRPLLISLHTSGRAEVRATAAERVRQQLPGRRTIALRIVTVPSLEALTVPAALPLDTDYIIYTRR
jgi:uncharacterized iron-regulated protein